MNPFVGFRDMGLGFGRDCLQSILENVDEFMTLRLRQAAKDLSHIRLRENVHVDRGDGVNFKK